MNDLRYAARTLRRTPQFTFTIIASLATGLALAMTTFAVANAYLIRTLPYPNAARLHHVMYAPAGPWEPGGMSSLDWTALGDVVETTVVSGGEALYIGDAAAPQYVRGLRVSPGFLNGLGVTPALGGFFDDDEFTATADRSILLSHDVWRTRFNGATDVIGREIRTASENDPSVAVTLRIIGILPAGFSFGRTSAARPDFLLPMHSTARAYMIALRPGVSPAQAEQRITAAARIIATDMRPGWTGVHLEGVHERYVADSKPVISGITIAALLVLVLVGTNATILGLLRSLRRTREIGVRFALGAGRTHILRILTAEAVLVCTSAVLFAWGLSALALRFLGPSIEERVGRPPPSGSATLVVDGHVALVTCIVTLFIIATLTLVPYAAASIRHQRDGVGSRRLRSALIAVQVAGALVLLAGAGLMLRSTIGLVRTDLGFDASAVVRTRLVLPPAYADNPQAMSSFYRTLAERVTDLTPLSSLSSSFPPFYPLNAKAVEGDGSPAGTLQVGVLPVGARYFAVHGMSLMTGREFTLNDRDGAAPVAVVSASLAEQLWPDGGAIGRRVRIATEESDVIGEWRTVVGVLRDTRQSYDDNDLRDVYVPFLQTPARWANVQVRAASATRAHATLVKMIADLDPLVRVEEPIRLSDEDQQLARTQFLTLLLGGFAAVALAVAILGVFGVTAYIVQQRRREIAIRSAIGASGRTVSRMLLKESGTVLLIGTVIGLCSAFAGRRILQSQLVGTPGADFVSLGGAAFCLLAACAIATWLPARRAALDSDLFTALREQ